MQYFETDREETKEGPIRIGVEAVWQAVYIESSMSWENAGILCLLSNFASFPPPSTPHTFAIDYSS